jgi:hypothetical protein
VHPAVLGREQRLSSVVIGHFISGHANVVFQHVADLFREGADSLARLFVLQRSTVVGSMAYCESLLLCLEVGNVE